MGFKTLVKVRLEVDLPNLGARLKKAREESGLDPTSVAANASMSVANLYRIESEKLKALPAKTLLKLCEVLGINMEDEIKKAEDEIKKVVDKQFR
ncbi:MAG: helix-turn-helix domain-containing protein [Symploca sp. SIO1B1]|nr:helix-turn-helix domain-containing protein [Symploca sp. SIO1B1]